MLEIDKCKVIGFGLQPGLTEGFGEICLGIGPVQERSRIVQFLEDRIDDMSGFMVHQENVVIAKLLEEAAHDPVVFFMGAAVVRKIAGAIELVFLAERMLVGRDIAVLKRNRLIRECLVQVCRIDGLSVVLVSVFSGEVLR